MEMDRSLRALVSHREGSATNLSTLGDAVPSVLRLGQGKA